MSNQFPAGSNLDSPWLEVSASRHFPEWLARERVSLAVTTYQTGKLLLIGLNDVGQLVVFERTFQRALGLWASAQTLWLSTLFQIWRLENVLAPGQSHEGHDRLYVPRVGYTTGDLDVHDIAVESSGRVVFVNTRFSCLATFSERDSFAPLWQPPFVSKLAAEDRCHLNGLALADGRVRYVTAVSTSDVTDGWRDRRAGGGIVMDVISNETIATGLSMPHSPRMYRGRLWLHNSGTGDFGSLDPARGTFEPLCFCPGYARGLAFVGDYAVLGLSRPRHDKTFTDLPLSAALATKAAEVRTGIHVVDLKSGDTVHWMRIEGMISELYDVAVLPGVVRPMAVGFKSDEIQRLLTIDAERAF